MTSWKPGGILLPQVTEESADIFHQELGLLESREVASSRHGGPPLQIVHAGGPFFGGPQDFLWKGRYGRGRLDPLTGAQPPGPVLQLMVQIE